MTARKRSSTKSTAHVRPSTGVAFVKTISAEELPNVPKMRAEPSALRQLEKRGYSPEEVSDLVVPKRTLARRAAQNEPLTVEETDKALRLVRVASLAESVFGEDEKAHRWLRKPKRALNGETPLSFLASEAGARVVEGMLLRIEHGILP
jgi:putative toxin-antitoxin system antitoxin component (TIGR02293 family)